MDNQPSAKPKHKFDSASPCLDLLKASEEHCTPDPSKENDSLGLFLGIHVCVCGAVESDYPDNIRQLNARFVANSLRRVKVYNDFIAAKARSASPETVPQPDLPLGWKSAFAIYEQKARDLTNGLPAFASAHILEDLPEALRHVRQTGVEVTKQEYDTVLPAILKCLHQCAAELTLLENPKAKLWFFLGQVHIGKFRIAEIRIEDLRDKAWELANLPPD